MMTAQTSSSLGPEAEAFDPVTGDLFMMTFRPQRSGLDGRVFTDRSWFECVFRAIDADSRLVIADMVAGQNYSGRPHTFDRDRTNFYRCSEERLALLNRRREAAAAQDDGLTLDGGLLP